MTPSAARLRREAEILRLRAEADRLEAELAATGPWLNSAQRRVLRYVVASGGAVSTLDLSLSKVLQPRDYLQAKSLVELGLLDSLPPDFRVVQVTAEGRRVCSTFGKPSG